MLRLGEDYEIIFINDGSDDTSLKILESLPQGDSLVIINFAKNRGQSIAYQEGIQKARGEIIITLDADLQNDPSDIPHLIRKLEEGFDVICGWRKSRRDPFLTKILSRIANITRRLLLKEKLHDVNCSLRAYRKKSLAGIDFSHNMYYMLTAILAQRGYRMGEVEVKHYPRKLGKTKFNVGKRMMLTKTLFRFLRNY